MRNHAIRIWALMTALSLAIPAALAHSGPPPGSPVALHGALSISNGQVVDEHGQPVTLRGMSLFWSQWKPQFYDEKTIAWLAKDWKVSLIRAAIAVQGKGGYIDDPAAQMKLADAAIGAAIDQGIYVLVDWHAHHPETKAAIRFFTAVARKYGDTPNIIYETFNEPLPDEDWRTVIRPYHVAVIGAIRAIDPDNLVVAGTQSWSQDVDKAAADPLPFSNLAYTLHFYAGTHKQALRDKADKALALGAALFVTEYGTVNADGNGAVDLAETQRWWDWMEKHHISYANWSVSDKPESSAALKPGALGDGGWSPDELTPSGALIRDHLRSEWLKDHPGWK